MKESETEEEVFLDNGRFRRTFARARAVGVRGSVVFRALHWLDREWYAVRRVMVIGEGQVRETVKRLKGLTEVFHPNILTFITSWAEEWRGRTAKIKAKTGAAVQKVAGKQGDSDGPEGFKEGGVSQGRSGVCESANLLGGEDHQGGSESRKKFAIFVQMELGRGEQLGHYLRRHAPSSAESFFIFGEIAKGLAYLHSRGIAHNRLDPEHVFLRGDCIKLTFHGIERSRAGEKESDIFALGKLLSQLIEPSPHEREPRILVGVLTNKDPEKRPKSSQIFAIKPFVAWGEKIARELGPQEDLAAPNEGNASWER